MDSLMAIRSGIFLVAGLLTIIFRKELNNFRHHLFKKFHIKDKKNQIRSYVYVGILFIIISVVLLVYAVVH